jgi:SAM-dependent methyltransferase
MVNGTREMSDMSQAPDPGISPENRAGARNYRAWVGPVSRFDTISAQQFGLLTLGGLRDRHTMLDIGCGSLRAGRLFITYLQPGHYYGLEPEKWVLEEGIREMLGQEFIDLRQPTFSHDANFTLTDFGQTFDFLLAQSIFSHTTRDQMERCFSEARKVVHPESKFFATFVPGDVDYDGDEWVYPGIVHFRVKTMREVAAEHGFTMQLLEWPHPAQQWALFRPVEAGKPKLPPALRPNQQRIAKLEARVTELEAELATARHSPGARVEAKARRMAAGVRRKIGS